MCGCAMLLPHDVLKEVGLFDERMFLYYEDTDLSLRIRAAGKRCVVVPGATMKHLVSKTAVRGSPLSIYYQTRNRLLFLKLHARGFSRRRWLILRNSLSRFWRGLHTYARGYKREGTAYMKAVVHYYLGRFGKCREFSA